MVLTNLKLAEWFAALAEAGIDSIRLGTKELAFYPDRFDSTFFNMIGALDRPSSGRVFIDEVDVAQLTAEELAYVRCQKIGYIFQSYNLIQYMTALENVTTPMVFVGVMPGLSASTGLALMVPFTFGMEPMMAIILLASIYLSSAYGGTITAIAINTPGTPAAVAVAMDGYALTKKGEPGRALGASLLANTTGGMVGTIILIFLSVPIAKVALQFGPPAFFSLAIFGLTIVAAMEAKNRLKAFFSTALGLLLMTVGLDIINAHPRFTFGNTNLFDGFSFIPALIGLFALGEIFLNIEKLKEVKGAVKAFSSKMPGMDTMWPLKTTILKSAGIGAMVGAIPGAGATIAAFIAYGEARRSSKKPDEFGHGSLEGVTAPSAAAGASEGGALVPLLTLGIPGSAATAVMIGALTLHNITPGPELFKSNTTLVYALFASLFVGNLFMLMLGTLGNKLWVKLIAAPKAWPVTASSS